MEPRPDLVEVGRAAWVFPLVAAMMGAVLSISHYVLVSCFPAALAAVLVVAIWVILTGGLHLDGWTDCWDALAASVSTERRYEILKDSRLGTFGAAALAGLLAVKVTALAGSDSPGMILFVAPIIGRGVMVMAGSRGRHHGEGMASLFLSGLDSTVVSRTTVMVAVAAILAGWTGVVALGVAYGGAAWFRRFAESRLSMVNGDVLGGMCELSEALVLIVGSLRW